MKFTSLVVSLAIAAASCSAVAQGVTIGGTATDGETAGLMAMFAGDRFDNFRNMDRFVPTSKMSASPSPWDLGKNSGSLKFEGDFLGKPTSLEQFIELSGTSSFIVIQNGKVIFEDYRHGDSRKSLHTSFPVAKSFTSAIMGVALEEGHIESLDDPVRKYLPELTSKTYDGVTVKHVLQMSSGIHFTEVYSDAESDINRMSALIPPMSYLEYMNTLGRDREPGTYNAYASINTQLLGLLLVRERWPQFFEQQTRFYKWIPALG